MLQFLRTMQGVQELQLHVCHTVRPGPRVCVSAEADLGTTLLQVPAYVPGDAGPHGPLTQHEQVPQPGPEREHPVTHREYNAVPLTHYAIEEHSPSLSCKC